MFVCFCVFCKCMSVCSGEVDCESSHVTHKALAIKEAHFNTLSYGKKRRNAQMDTHAIYTQTCSVSQSSDFSLKCLYRFRPSSSTSSSSLVFTVDTHTQCVCFAREKTLTRSKRRADTTICGFGDGSRRQGKKNQSVPVKYSMSPASYSSWSPNNKSHKSVYFFIKCRHTKKKYIFVIITKPFLIRPGGF